MPVDDCSLLAVAQFGVADTSALGRTAQRVALFDSDLVIRITLVLRCLLARVGLFHCRILLCVGGYAVDLGVGLGLDQRRVRFLHAHVLGIARNIVTFFLGDTVGRFGTRDARILTRLRRGLVSGFCIGLGDLFLAARFRETDVLGVAAP